MIVSGLLKAQRTSSPTRTSSLVLSNMPKLWCARTDVVAAQTISVAHTSLGSLVIASSPWSALLRFQGFIENRILFLSRQVAREIRIPPRIDAAHVVETRFAGQAELRPGPALVVGHQERVLVALALPVAQAVARFLERHIAPERIRGSQRPHQRQLVV